MYISWGSEHHFWFFFLVLFLLLGSGTILNWFLVPVPFLGLGSGTVLVPICTNLTYLIISPHITRKRFSENPNSCVYK